MLCAANIMSRRVVFCCGAFSAKLVRSDTKERERQRGRKREGKAPQKTNLFPLISSLSLFFFKTLNIHIGKKRRNFFEVKNVESKQNHATMGVLPRV